jgi:hypothetical protein
MTLEKFAASSADKQQDWLKTIQKNYVPKEAIQKNYVPKEAIQKNYVPKKAMDVLKKDFNALKEDYELLASRKAIKLLSSELNEMIFN